MSYSPPPIPTPALPLEYPAPQRDGRPGVITAIGVISIVVASLGLLGNLIGGFYAMGLSFAAYASQRAATTATVARSSTARWNLRQVQQNAAQIADDLPAGPRGLGKTERNHISIGLENVRRLNNGEQRERLKQLLAKCGKDAFPFADPSGGSPNLANLDEAAQRNVSDSGQLPSATSADGAVYYVIGSGKIEVYDDHAVFFPSDGDDRTPVRVAKGVSDDAPTQLLPGDIDALVAHVQAIGGAGATQVQLDALKKALADPEQQIISLGPNNPAPTQQISAASLDPNSGALTLYTLYHGFVIIDKQGTLTDMAAFNARMIGGFRLRTSGVVMAIADAVGSFLLSIYLLVIGILVLRQSLRGRRLHLVYAWLKLPLIALGAIGWMMLVRDFATSITRMAPPGGGGPSATTAMSAGFATMLGILSLISLAYPVALLIVLRTKRVREYYSGVQA